MVDIVEKGTLRGALFLSTPARITDTAPMRAIRIHGIDDIRAALTAAAFPHAAAPPPLLLVSAPGAGRTLGAGWWRALQDAMDAAFPVPEGVRPPARPPPLVLDCADAAGRALEALAAGVRHVALGDGVRHAALDDGELAPGVRARVAAIAAARGATLHPALATLTGPHPPLDLRGRRDPVAACRAWLATPG